MLLADALRSVMLLIRIILCYSKIVDMAARYLRNSDKTHISRWGHDQKTLIRNVELYTMNVHVDLSWGLQVIPFFQSRI